MRSRDRLLAGVIDALDDRVANVEHTAEQARSAANEARDRMPS
jgi:hypothetical protein